MLVISKMASIINTNTPCTLKFSKLSTFETNVILESVFKCIKCACSFGGKVYGGFVRDIIVPKLENPDFQGTFKDVDIWFTSQESADNFVDAMGSLFVKSITIKDDAYTGCFSRSQYYLIYFGACLAWIDVIVSPTLPVNDFDVNEVTFTINENDEWKTDSPRRLISQIKNKEAIMLKPYAKLMSEALEKSSNLNIFNPSFKSYYKNRIDRIFTSKGWKVYIPKDLSYDK